MSTTKPTFFLILLLGLLPTFAQKTVSFAGMDWFVRNGNGGPGPNQWSDADDQVWVDGNGDLHLTIRKIGDTWYCSEIYAQQSLGYGTYQFYVDSPLENYDPQIVVGLFTYEDDQHEIDVEFSKWGNPSNPSGWYTVQPPPYSSDNQQYFDLNLTGAYSTHLFEWNNSSIFFQSYHGHYPILPSASYLINEWNYTGSQIPNAGNERLHLNFWLFQGQTPTNQQDAELIIKRVFYPSSLPISSLETNLKVTSYPNPVSDVLYLELQDEMVNVNFEIINALGQSVYQGNFLGHTSLPTSSWSPGVYTLKVESQGILHYQVILKE